MLMALAADLRVLFANLMVALFQSDNDRLIGLGYFLLKIRFHISREKKQILEKRQWHRNPTGGYTHPYGMNMLHRWEIAAMTPDRLRYAMRHGVDAPYPAKGTH